MDLPATSELPFGPGQAPWVLRIGARPVGLDRWLDLTGDVVAALVEKDRTLAAHRGEVVAALPGSEVSGAELRDEVVSVLLAHGGGRWHRSGDAVVRPDGAAVDLEDGHGVDVAGRLVPDDVLVLEGEGNRLVAASVASPNRWKLAEKMGQTLTAVHDPVPGYERVLASPVDRMMAALRPDRPIERRNWAVTDDPTGFQPVPRRPDPDLDPADVPDRLWLRMEREGLRRLPRTGAVVFSIRTHQWPLSAVAGPGGAETARGLAAALEALPDDLAAYKSLVTYRAPILAWLRSLEG